MKKYDLLNDKGQVCRCGCPFIEIDEKGNETLYSYNTPILIKYKNGDIKRIWAGWSQTTQKHIKYFCGLNKAGFDKLELLED